MSCVFAKFTQTIAVITQEAICLRTNFTEDVVISRA